MHVMTEINVADSIVQSSDRQNYRRIGRTITDTLEQYWPYVLPAPTIDSCVQVHSSNNQVTAGRFKTHHAKLVFSLQCFDTVGWATGRTSGL